MQFIIIIKCISNFLSSFVVVRVLVVDLCSLNIIARLKDTKTSTLAQVQASTSYKYKYKYCNIVSTICFSRMYLPVHGTIEYYLYEFVKVRVRSLLRYDRLYLLIPCKKRLA